MPGTGPTAEDAERCYFFLHIMKTGGTSFLDHIYANFPRDDCYPAAAGPRGSDTSLFAEKTSAMHLLLRPTEDLSNIRVFSVHQAFWVCPALSEKLGKPLATLTVLRDPVERTVSHLKQIARQRSWTRSLEELYELPALRGWVLWNHQIVQLCLTRDDEVDMARRASVLLTGPPDDLDIGNPIVLDAARVATARANLARIDVYGFTDRLDEFTRAVDTRWGWKPSPGRRMNEGPPAEISEHLRRMIEADNVVEIEFFEHARSTAMERP